MVQSLYPSDTSTHEAEALARLNERNAAESAQHYRANAARLRARLEREQGLRR